MAVGGDHQIILFFSCLWLVVIIYFVALRVDVKHEKCV